MSFPTQIIDTLEDSFEYVLKNRFHFIMTTRKMTNAQLSREISCCDDFIYWAQLEEDWQLLALKQMEMSVYTNIAQKRALKYKLKRV